MGTGETHELIRQRLADVEAQIAQVKARRARLDADIVALEKEHIRLGQQLLFTPGGSNVPGGAGRITGKNLHAECAWAALHELFVRGGHGRHMPRHVMKAAVERALPGVIDSTFRSYLARFCRDGRLIRHTYGYSLASTDERSVASRGEKRNQRPAQPPSEA